MINVHTSTQTAQKRKQIEDVSDKQTRLFRTNRHALCHTLVSDKQARIMSHAAQKKKL